MLKLTDTQRVILSNSAKRRDGAVLPLPKSLKIKGGAVTKLLDSLRKKGLLAQGGPLLCISTGALRFISAGLQH